ncbi:MAG: hypothetical protein RLZZ303_838 [Candidatus Hydrogenedentota bacterium]|jgi:CubicO group peptidase (beta-lactamase class C family)
MGVLLALLGWSAHAESVEQLVARELEGLVRKGHLKGAAVGVVSGDSLHTFYFGVIRDGGPPPDAATLFEIGSITKAFTGTLLAAQHLKGEVELESPLKAYLPADVSPPQYQGKEILLRHLASHVSGLPRLPDNLSGPDEDPYAGYTEHDLLAFLSGHRLRRAPGETYEYSNYGAALLGLAMSRRAGQSYETLLRERLLAPLGMHDTTITLSPDQRARLAQGHAITLELGLFRQSAPVPPWDLAAMAPAGGAKSTLPDMMRFLHAAMGNHDGLREAFRLAQQPLHDAESNLAVGLCWHILNDPDKGRQVVWHNGGTGGYSSFLGFDPERGDGVVILANTQNLRVDRAALAILDGLLAL